MIFLWHFNVIITIISSMSVRMSLFSSKSSLVFLLLCRTNKCLSKFLFPPVPGTSSFLLHFMLPRGYFNGKCFLADIIKWKSHTWSLYRADYEGCCSPCIQLEYKICQEQKLLFHFYWQIRPMNLDNMKIH